MITMMIATVAQSTLGNIATSP